MKKSKASTSTSRIRTKPKQEQHKGGVRVDLVNKKIAEINMESIKQVEVLEAQLEEAVSNSMLMASVLNALVENMNTNPRMSDRTQDSLIKSAKAIEFLISKGFALKSLAFRSRKRG